MAISLSKEHRILEKGMMEFQPFGRRPDGTYIRDISGLVTSSTVKHVEDVVSRTQGADAGRRAVEELVRLDNERIPDPAYRVTIDFLKNPWNSYSSEFAAFNGEFCVDLSGDPLFNLSMAREKAISPIIQVLGRAFSVQQIYQMSLYFSQRYSKNSFYTEALHVGDRSATIRMRLDENTVRQFGPYRMACAKIWCDSHKGYFIGVPEQFHHLPPATVEDRYCIAEGDEYCEWMVTWPNKRKRAWPVLRGITTRRSGSADPIPAIGPSVALEKPDRHGGGAAEFAPSVATKEGRSVGAAKGTPARLLAKERHITEKGMMEFQPFGTEPDGTPIRDLSGIIIRACVENLAECVNRTRGEDAGRRAVDELVCRLNERISDEAYHVTAPFLKNPWNSYAMEFSAFLAQFCVDISGDPHFHFTMVRERGIPPIIQVLGRPFSVPQIYKMSRYFSERYTTKDTYYVEPLSVSDRSAIVRMVFKERAYRHFGVYLKGCAQYWCDGTKAFFVATPEKFHGLPPAIVTDRRCLAEGDEYCEWEVTWTENGRRWWSIPNWLGRPVQQQVAAGSSESRLPAYEPQTSPAPPVERASHPVAPMLSNDHRITEKAMMEFQPFGVEPDGTSIRDLSGVVIRADVEYMEEYVAQKESKEAAREAVVELARRLNERIPDQAFHVTPDFLCNPWNSYSAEFAAFTAEFCIAISGDPDFLFNMARTKAISAIILALGRPFSVAQIYKMSAYFAQRYSKDSFYTEAVQVSKRSAIIQMTLSPRTYRQFGVYRRACAEHWCHAHKGYFVAVPEMFHGLPEAAVTDRLCIVNGDDRCEWEVTWSDKKHVLETMGTRSSWQMTGRHHQAERAVTEPESIGESCAMPATKIESPDSSPDVWPSSSSLLSKDHVITEKGMMEFQPFGVETDGKAIRDLSGVTIRASLDYLEDYVSRTKSTVAGRQAVDELARRLNERIADRGYHVTPAVLRNSWNSYSYEFSAYLSQFCSDISGDLHFPFNMARQKAISSFVQVLGRPFSVSRIYKMSSQFAHIYSGKTAYSVEAVGIADHSAKIRMRFGKRAYQHFGLYLKACALLWCEAHKGYFVAVPEKFHQLPPAAITDQACIARGDPYCEWDISWSVEERSRRYWPVLTSLAHHVLRQQIEERERLIDEQVRTLDIRHVELQEAYVHQQQTTAELQRRVDHLTILHDAGLVFGSILDRETLIDRVLTTIVDKLHYDRAMLRFFDQDRRVAYDARIIGVPSEIADLVRSQELPVTDADSLEGKVFLRGDPILITDIHEILDRLHPMNQQLVTLVGATSIISVPLKVQNRILGSLTVDRTRQHSLTQDDLSVMVTLGSQVAIALDNTYAYREIEELNLGLEAKVRARTAALEQFLTRISHDLRTPLTSICGFADNMLDGLAGPLTDKQGQYLTRMLANGRRLGRLVDNLLDMLVDPDKIRLSLNEVDLSLLSMDVIEQLRPLALAKHQSLDVDLAEGNFTVWADADKLTRVLTNLVDNAIKYTPPQGSITVKVAAKDHFAMLSVSDTGEGIHPEALSKIFDPGFSVNRENQVEVISHRIGLSIVKDLVERHGGTITITSEVGKGTTFSFTIPLVRIVKTKERKGEGKTVKRLLVADDDSDIRQMLRDRLTAAGYSITTAGDGQQALSSLQNDHFDGIILDIGMPRMSGLDVLSKVHAARPTVPIIMITAASSEERALLALQSGANAYLLKPFDPGHLIALVEQVIGPST